MSKKKTPTELTLEAIEADGGRGVVVEHYDARARRRHDLLGFIDILAFYPGRIVGIQATDDTNLSKRRKKILQQKRDAAVMWLESGGLIQCWGWRAKLDNATLDWDYTLLVNDIVLHDTQIVDTTGLRVHKEVESRGQG